MRLNLQHYMDVIKTMDYWVNILFLRLYAIAFVCIAFKDGYKYGCVVY